MTLPRGWNNRQSQSPWRRPWSAGGGGWREGRREGRVREAEGRIDWMGGRRRQDGREGIKEGRRAYYT